MNTASASPHAAGRIAKAALLSVSGVAAWARKTLAGEAAVLAFHGICEKPDGSVLDEALHLPVETFERVCRHLAKNYEVLPLAEISARLLAGEKLPARTVGLSFDDGYASNYGLAFPVLKELGLPATIFLATGFLDGDQPLWFQQVDLALLARHGRAGVEKLGPLLARLKAEPDEAMRQEVAVLMAGQSLSAPPVTRPLSWDQVREMQASGLIAFGAHTHSHPILARCTTARQRQEIYTSRDRLAAELGQAPQLFAFPNGGGQDYGPETLRLLAEAGFESAWTMVPGRVRAGGSGYELPRYGSPASVWEAEATVSGAYELVRRWKGGGA